MRTILTLVQLGGSPYLVATTDDRRPTTATLVPCGRRFLRRRSRQASVVRPLHPARNFGRAVLVALLGVCALLALAPGAARAEQERPAQLAQRVYLPVVSQAAGPPAVVRFGTGLSGGRVTGAGTSFAAGRTALFYEVDVADGAGLPFRIEWTLNGQRRPELDRTGALPADGGPFSGGIALSTQAPLPTGLYVLRVFVNGLSSGAGQATIQ